MYDQDYNVLAKAEANKEKSELRRYGILGGVCVIGFLLIQELLALPLRLFGLIELYNSDMLFYQAVGMFITVFAICTPFLLCGLYEKKYTTYEIFPMDKPKDSVLSVLAIPAGVSLCLMSSMVTGYLTAFLEQLGLKLTSPDMSLPDSGFELVLYFMRLTIVAAVIEEISFRGVIMQPLRKYGDGFAISMAAIIFGLVHCNLIQAPFAFLAGLVIGYFTIVTDSLWTGIFIHLLNNSVSGILSYISANFGEEVLLSAGNVIYTAVMIIGFVCLALFFLRKGGISTHGRRTFISKGAKVKAYLLNLPMILAFIAICWYTMPYIEI